MRTIWLTAIAGVLALCGSGQAWASDWGGIEPGVTTAEQVRERYGAPSKETKGKVDNYDTVTLIYEGTRAPSGINKLTVELGLLTKDGYKPNLVRVFRLEPKPSIFPLRTVMDGWGMPSAAGDGGGRPTFFYEDGLVVIFDPQGIYAENMSFTMPQPLPPVAGQRGQPGQPATGAPKPAPTPGPAAPQPPSGTRPRP